MEKVVMGLSGIVLSFAGIVGFTGCKSTINEEINAIMYHSNEIRKILKVKPEETCQIVETTIKKGEPFSVIIRGENEDKIMIYNDKNKDGKYEKNTFTLPHKLDIIVIPPEPNQPKDELKKYFQEKKNEPQKKDKSKLWVYDL